LNSSYKDTEFIKQITLNLGGKLRILDKPLVMGIINLSKDSFYRQSSIQDEGNFNDHLINKVRAMQPWCDLLDIGAVSTRPGAKGISREEEIQQISTALKILKPVFPELFFSVDTWRSGVAEVAVNEGAVMINDISGGTMDSEMFTTISKLKVPYILMHIQGTPETMQSKPHYHDVVLDIKQFFAERLQILRDLGVKDVILDPGFGFGKTVEHNFQLLNSLDAFRVFGLPVLAGLSRKSFIQKTLGVSAEDALNGTTVLNTLAVLKGANILRVHDPREAREIVLLTRKMLIKAD